ncbi:MAG: FAD-binding oxidoreductase [Pseudomonadota bacterium]
MPFDRTRFLRALHSAVCGDVLDSDADRARFSVDESIFTLLPEVVVAPKDEADVRAVVSVAREFGVPITSRAGGSGVAAQSIGTGIILDFKPHFGKILQISSDSVTVEPGVILLDLNRELAKVGRRFVPDPSSKDVCAIGGMVATNASGPHSYTYGTTREHVRELWLVLSDGEATISSALAKKYPTLHAEIGQRRALIEKVTPKVRKNSSGYELKELLKDPPDYTRFLVGSEGTLALTTKIELRTIPLPEVVTLALLPFTSLQDALDAVPEVTELEPVAIELVDSYILWAMKTADPTMAVDFGLERAEACLFVEWESKPPRIGSSARIFEDVTRQTRLWELRSKGSKLLHEQAEVCKRKPLRCIEDSIVPVRRLSAFVLELKEILRTHDCDGAVFGHAGDGHVHVNPKIDISAPRLKERLRRLMEEVYSLVLRMGGSISGEHGDGMLRARYAGRQWGELLPLFQQVKDTFDSGNLFNPGKKITKQGAEWPPFRTFFS